jgi:hypothetical protein
VLLQARGGVTVGVPDREHLSAPVQAQLAFERLKKSHSAAFARMEKHLDARPGEVHRRVLGSGAPGARNGDCRKEAAMKSGDRE